MYGNPTDEVKDSLLSVVDRQRRLFASPLAANRWHEAGLR
ncbi:hypothetical protein TVNIR_1733 [Thioalkalivibrio nitratireducens DSM 14787]|uniref:Uncharacterized protein n=1 Tax=Thioalkalivibrio nitratireducens (strain DSM 14787 / UNIQEM 213 / ALEN2) TaxID=1255043 RepID=L0DWS1_THIND|nr:hypothetical protein TVNIR_1733 [Thioalkalivibrio nitratireducens DSM 14787]